LINAKGEIYADSVIEASITEANAQQDYGKRLQWIDKKAMAIILQYPADFAKLYLKGVAAFFLDPGRFDAYHFFHIDEQNTPGLMLEVQTKGFPAIVQNLQRAPLWLLILLLFSFGWNVFVVLVFIYFLLTSNLPRELRLLLFLFVCYIAAATGPVGVSRYRVPIYPLLFIGVLCVSPIHYTKFGSVKSP
jgi:hypothetical protein